MRLILFSNFYLVKRYSQTSVGNFRFQWENHWNWNTGTLEQFGNITGTLEPLELLEPTGTILEPLEPMENPRGFYFYYYCSLE